jgi:hypothetical protein
MSKTEVLTLIESLSTEQIKRLFVDTYFDEYTLRNIMCNLADFLWSKKYKSEEFNIVLKGLPLVDTVEINTMMEKGK